MNVIEIHETLNKLFVTANEMADYLEGAAVECELQYVAGNYLKVGEEYALQAYPIPVILVKKKGDIGFNLDGVFFEFFIKKQTALKLDVERFSRLYTLEVYGAKEAEQDYYSLGLSNEAFWKKIDKSKENGFGVAFYISEFTGNSEALYQAFDTCYRMIIKSA